MKEAKFLMSCRGHEFCEQLILLFIIPYTDYWLETLF